MDEVYESAKAFEKMFDIVYNMKISYKKELISFQLDFHKKDFFHLVGFQYLSDLDLGRSPEITFDNILNLIITDSLLSTSAFYLKVPDNYVVVKDRLRDFKYIEKCLDGKSVLFKYVKNKNVFSSIKADFMFEALLNHEIDGITIFDTYYVFFGKRDNSESYRLVSFFSKNTEIKGNTAYWLYKEKIDNLNLTNKILYQSKNLKWETYYIYSEFLFLFHK